jgi:hypothetical protein
MPAAKGSACTPLGPKLQLGVVKLYAYNAERKKCPTLLKTKDTESHKILV